MSELVYLNGTFLPLSQATISVMDRGFLFGDAVYEVIPLYQQQPFRFTKHLQRLRNSLQAIKLDFLVKDADWLAITRELLRQNPDLGANASLYLQISRGAYEKRAHTFPQQVVPTVFAKVTPLNFLSIEELALGKTAITAPDIRWQHCFIKTTSLLANVLLQQLAAEAKADEALLLDQQGRLIEGASSNVFIVQDNCLMTPPLSPRLLCGVTRDLVLELARRNDIAVQEKAITAAELSSAQEIWIASSTRSVCPIVRLDGAPVGKGTAGPLWRHMINLFYAFIARQENL